MKFRLGVDTGGTFTDVMLANDENGEVFVVKTLSSPENPALAIIRGVTELLEKWSITPNQLVYFAHGTTVSINAVLQRRVANTALIVTDGFADIMELARQRRPDLYDLDVEKPTQIVPRLQRFQIRERVASTGEILIALDGLELKDVVSAVERIEAEAVAVCLIHSYLNDQHEKEVRSVLEAKLPGVAISLSSEVNPEYREYERMSTTILDASLQPVMTRYLDDLVDKSANVGISPSPLVMQSNGGTVSAKVAAENPVNTLFSGPSAGVIAAATIGARAGFSNLISFDIGGTSTDVALIHQGKIPTTRNREIAGLPTRTSMVDVNSIGAGGGSLARVDSAGLLKVGPESAGASPGPACYGLGGEHPTVTDANMLLGLMNPEALLGGQMAIDVELARAALLRDVGGPLGLGAVEAAEGVLQVLGASLVRAVRVISVERGFDPREFTLVGYGGAGPAHAARLARDIGIRRVLIPPHPGLLSAMGLLLADVRVDFSAMVLQVLDPSDPSQLESTMIQLTSTAQSWLEAEGYQSENATLSFSADMRYSRQSFDLSVPIASSLSPAEAATDLLAAFHSAHEKAYGYSVVEENVELVNVRLEVIVRVEKAPTRRDRVRKHFEPEPSSYRRVKFSELQKFIDCATFRRPELRAGSRIIGPAMIDGMDSSIVVLPGQTATVDTHLNVLIEENS